MIRFGIIRFGSVNDTEASVFGYSVSTRFDRPLYYIIPFKLLFLKKLKTLLSLCFYTNLGAQEYLCLNMTFFVFLVHHILFLYKVQQKPNHHTFALNIKSNENIIGINYQSNRESRFQLSSCDKDLFHQRQNLSHSTLYRYV